MAQTYNTTGLILKRRDYQENDRLFYVYTKDHGKIEIVAKGTKKISSKLNSYLEPFYLVNLMIAKGKVFDKLANANIIKSYENLRNDKELIGFFLINYLSEIIYNLILGQTPQNKKYELLIELLDILDVEIIKERENKKEWLLFLSNIFMLKFLNHLGYRPEIQRCLVCHKAILLTKNIFDFSRGGVICEDCKKVCLIEDYIKVSDKVIKLLQLAETKDLKYFLSMTNGHDEINEFNKVLQRLILVNTERPIKSMEFYKVVP
ncbi:DNA repair protein RecO [Candidatus Falkowbacteria bacterium]|nr:DNA repair protein RecO [Candidatus Falkowbacteria bacterium]